MVAAKKQLLLIFALELPSILTLLWATLKVVLVDPAVLLRFIPRKAIVPLAVLE